MASISRIEVRLAVRPTARYPYYAARVLGPRAKPEPDELVVPLDLRIDSALFHRKVGPLIVEVPSPEAPTATAQCPT